MATLDQEKESLQEELEDREAGVADLMELYEKIEGIYVRASASMMESETVRTSDSTDVARGSVAHLG